MKAIFDFTDKQSSLLDNDDVLLATKRDIVNLRANKLAYRSKFTKIPIKRVNRKYRTNWNRYFTRKLDKTFKNKKVQLEDLQNVVV